MDDKRIKYFSNGDLSVGFYLERFGMIIDSIDDRPPVINDLNYALELSNVIKFIDNKLFDRRWTDEYIAIVRTKKSLIHRALKDYFESEIADNIFLELNDIDYDYKKVLLDKIEEFDLAKSLSTENFETAIRQSKTSFGLVLGSKYLVKKYQDVLKKLFLEDSDNIEYLVGLFSDSTKTKLHIPSMSKEEMLTLCNQYIDSDSANINYLRILMKPIKGIETYVTLDAKTRLKARKRAEALEDALFSEQPDNGISVKMAVLSSKEAYEKELKGSDPLDYIDYVDAEWIDAHHDYPTILNNIQYLYGLFNFDLHSSLPSFPKIEMGVLEPIMGVKTHNYYPDGQLFTIKQRMATMKIKALSELLKKYDIALEQIIDWFFADYCKEVFDIKWLPLEFPSRDQTFGNRTATLFRIEESIRTQYDVLVTHGVIDKEIVDLTNTPAIRELATKVDNKYAYPDDSSDIIGTTNLLFSDQSHITYISEKLNGKHFVDLIIKNDVKLTDFLEHQQPIVQDLIEKNLVIVAVSDQTLHVGPAYSIAALQRLYTYGVTNYHHVDRPEQIELDKLASGGKIRFGKTLFSEQEIDYFNYLLNNSSFDNSAGIRNKYQHGIPNYDNKGYYESDYLYALLILLTYVIKINDEFNLVGISEGKDAIICDFDV